MAFVRVDKSKPIRNRAEVREPDAVAVLDPSLLAIVNVLSGLKPGGILIINSKKPAQQLRDELGFTVPLAIVDATRIARDILGVPITNTTMVGAVIRVTGIVRLESVIPPLEDRFGRLAVKNIDAMKRAYAETVIEESPNGQE